MRLTLRKFHLLLAEWRLGQRFIENRWYRLYAVTGGWEKPPEPWEAFQFLNQLSDNGTAPVVESDLTPDMIDDAVIFQQASAPLTMS